MTRYSLCQRSFFPLHQTSSLKAHLVNAHAISNLGLVLRAIIGDKCSLANLNLLVEAQAAGEESSEKGGEAVKCEEDEFAEAHLALTSVEVNLTEPDGPANKQGEEVALSDVQLEGEVGKSPVYLRCPVCAVVLPSILTFTKHMRTRHKDSQYEKNKPFSCDICGRGFYFESCLNAHRSKGHGATAGTTFKYDYGTFLSVLPNRLDRFCSCPMCSAVTSSKASLKRHLIKVHKVDASQAPEGDPNGGDGKETLCRKCPHCDAFFWSAAKRVAHIAAEHPEAEGRSFASCSLCAHISSNRASLKRHHIRRHQGQNFAPKVTCYLCNQVSMQAIHDAYQCPVLANSPHP